MWSRIKAHWSQIAVNWRDYPLQPGTVWDGRYTIERLLGMGSYGQAYACRDGHSGATVLLKRNKPSKGSLGIELLRRESETMKRLSHPQIPRWLGYGKQGRDEALIMEYVNGHNLEYAVYEQQRRFETAEALRLLRELLEPIGHIHAAGIVHRDVRIPNVLLDGGVPKLVDFGLACRIGERLPEELRLSLGERDGWPEDSAAATRQRMRAPYPSSDWFGLGHLFLFLMYAGYEHPAGEREASWEEELKLPGEVQDFIGRLLNDEHAWADTESCARELDALIASLPPGAGESPPL